MKRLIAHIVEKVFKNQTKQDYKMPLRVISYDGASYEKVYNESNFGKGGFSMCDVVQRIINEGKAAGKAEERKGIIINLVSAKAGTIE